MWSKIILVEVSIHHKCDIIHKIFHTHIQQNNKQFLITKEGNFRNVNTFFFLVNSSITPKFLMQSSTRGMYRNFRIMRRYRLRCCGFNREAGYKSNGSGESVVGRELNAANDAAKNIYK